MIPVRVPGDALPAVVGLARGPLSRNHAAFHARCPVDDKPIGAAPFVLVHVGTHPDDRRAESGWTTGAAVAVHAACAGIDPHALNQPDRSPAMPEQQHVAVTLTFRTDKSPARIGLDVGAAVLQRMTEGVTSITWHAYAVDDEPETGDDRT